MRLILLCCLSFVLSQVGLAQEGGNPAKETQVEYICPMYCTDDISSTPAECRICGMEMEDKSVVENPKEYRILSTHKALETMKANQDIVLLDVRSKGEYNGELGHLENSILIPISELEKRVDELETHKDKTIIAYCSHGVRSARAAKLLTKKGFSVFSLSGGLTKWNREEKPVVRE